MPRAWPFLDAQPVTMLDEFHSYFSTVKIFIKQTVNSCLSYWGGLGLQEDFRGCPVGAQHWAQLGCGCERSSFSLGSSGHGPSPSPQEASGVAGESVSLRGRNGETPSCRAETRHDPQMRHEPCRRYSQPSVLPGAVLWGWSSSRGSWAREHRFQPPETPAHFVVLWAIF